MEKFKKWKSILLSFFKIIFISFLFKPFDLAIKENNTAAVNLLNEQVGNDMISTYLKTKPNEIKP